MFSQNRQPQKKSLLSRLSGIAGIVSATIVCIRLTWMGLISMEWAAITMVAVVVLTALGNSATKLGISAIAIYLFSKLVSKGDEVHFQAIIASLITLIVMLIGLYIMLKGVFGRK